MEEYEDNLNELDQFFLGEKRLWIFKLQNP